MKIAILLCCIVMIALLLIISAMLIHAGANRDSKELMELKKQVEFLRQDQTRQSQVLMDQAVRQNETMVTQLSVLGSSLRDSQDKQQAKAVETLSGIETKMHHLRTEILTVLDSIRRSNAEDMEKLRKDNQESLDKINHTVNEKLQKTLDDKISKSFETVNKRLAEVYEGLGEMKNVASGVSDLKNVLSNVKTRGIMGEIQLGAILSEILAPEQYGEQIPVTPGGSEKVDFAVKLPGAADGESVYLPIDSKFPGDTYSNLLAAYESGDPELLKAKRTALEAEIKKCAKSIHDKYIVPPHTTDFAILFLPFEGLYAEVVNMGLVEVLQRNYKVNIAGPSTMAAMLNSLQMGFRTLAIQKKSGEVWKILEAAKKEFGNFETVLTNTRNRLRQADEELDKLIGTRTRAINRKLQTVSELNASEKSEKLLDIT
ncbi:MAG: DNA recombination protein RmuC [Ruminococcus sp.]